MVIGCITELVPNNETNASVEDLVETFVDQQGEYEIIYFELIENNEVFITASDEAGCVSGWIESMDTLIDTYDEVM